MPGLSDRISNTYAKISFTIDAMLKRLACNFVLLLFSCKSSVVGPVDENENGELEDSESAESKQSLCTNRDGTRLKENYAQTSDGIRDFISIYDSEMKTFCQPADNGDGIERCYPMTIAGYVGKLVYTDASCSLPLAAFGPTEKKSAIITQVDKNSCDVTNQYRRVTTGVELEEGAQLYAVNSTGGCGAVDLPNDKIYRVGEPLANLEFVSLSSELSNPENRLSISKLLGSDNSSWCMYYREYWDSERQEECFGGKVSGGSERCLPVGEKKVVGSKENNCLQASDWVAKDSCQKNAPKYASQSTREDCQLVSELYRVEKAAESTTTLYLEDGDTCAMAESKEHYAVGDPIDNDEFAKLETRSSPGTQRLNPIVSYHDNKKIGTFSHSLNYPTNYFYDNFHETNCFPQLASDGVRRCLPSFSLLFSDKWYSDSSCSTAIEAASQDACDEVDTKFLFNLKQREQIFVALKHEEPTYQKIDSECTLVGPDIQILTKGASVSMATFEEFTKVEFE